MSYYSGLSGHAQNPWQIASVVHTVSGFFEVGKLAKAYFTFIVMVSFPWEEKDKWGKKECLGSQEDYLNPVYP